MNITFLFIYIALCKGIKHSFYTLIFIKLLLIITIITKNLYSASNPNRNSEAVASRDMRNISLHSLECNGSCPLAAILSSRLGQWTSLKNNSSRLVRWPSFCDRSFFPVSFITQLKFYIS